ncbi:MAG TPA: urate hydroxylase PuuD [Candidatus Sulfotelmatobacter sp.]|nr:urate hydroxylase PuuD [Candidatus Sulfotelmatobacter sp.]
MKNPLDSLHKTLAIGLVVAIILALIFHRALFGEEGYWAGVLRWLHVFFGILWIGLLYYFNFVQTPSMPKIPDDQKPAITKFIAPSALFFFRWAAMLTIIFGLLLAGINHYIVEALTLQAGSRVIGVGMWLGIIMWFNVWFLIWPNQKKVLGIVEASADEKKRGGRVAALASRTNTLLSIPMLYCMIGQSHMGTM